ncbi:hypothetical protein PENSPDRAFT_690624 [Peniophora sp. CONT]|nr:hypothetical protein PENSPDRAFT_690624 [Peniophora sp. CONT]
MSFDSTATESSAPRRHTIKRKPAPQYLESPRNTSPLILDISLSGSASATANSWKQDATQEYRDLALAVLEGYRLDDPSRVSVVASPAVSPTTLVASAEGHEIALPSPAVLGRSSSRSPQNYERPLSGIYPTARKASTQSSTGTNSRDTSRRPSRSQRLPRKMSVVDVFRPPTPPQAVHVRSDPSYLPSPATAEFRYEELRMPVLPGETTFDLARFDSHATTLASGTAKNALSSDESMIALKAEEVAVADTPQRPMLETMRSNSTWRPPSFLAHILRDWWRKEERGEVTIEEPYKCVHKRALEPEMRPPPVSISLPYLDGHAAVGPITPVDLITPVTAERAALWRVDADTGFAAMHVMTLKPDADERQNGWNEECGCFPTFNALKGCFGLGGREH